MANLVKNSNTSLSVSANPEDVEICGGDSYRYTFRLIRNGSLYNTVSNVFTNAWTWNSLPEGTYTAEVENEYEPFGDGTGWYFCTSAGSNQVTLSTAFCIPSNATDLSMKRLARFYGLPVENILLSGPNNPSSGESIFGKSDLPNTGTISKTRPNAMSELRGTCGGVITWADSANDYGDAVAVAVGINGACIAYSANTSSWVVRTLPFNYDMNNVVEPLSSVSNLNYWFCAGTAALGNRSSDGFFWEQRFMATFNNNPIRVMGRNTSCIWVIYGVLMEYSTNGGASWNLALNGPSFQNMNAWYGTGTLIYLGGNNGIISSSTFPYSSWNNHSSGTSKNIRGGSKFGFINATASFVLVGDNGLILTKNGNNNSWTQRSSGTTQRLNDVWCTTGFAVVVGNAGTIRTSTDGVTWTARTSGTTANLNSVTNTSIGLIAVGDGGVVLISTNSGVSWSQMTSNTTQNLKSIAGIQFINP